MSRDLEENNYYTSAGGVIPVKWTAPEVSHSVASEIGRFMANSLWNFPKISKIFLYLYIDNYGTNL